MRMNAIKLMAEQGGMQALSVLDLDSLRATLDSAFKEVDGSGCGQLDQEQVTLVLERVNAAGGLNLTDSHMRAMFAAIDADESGTVDWTELVNFICDALEHMEREALIANMAMTAVGEEGVAGGGEGEEADVGMEEGEEEGAVAEAEEEQ